MVKIDEEDNRIIHITRGDTTIGEFNRLAFDFDIEYVKTKEREKYKFKPDDKITFVVVDKKGYTKIEILRKEYTPRQLGYLEPATSIELPLTAEETKKFPLKNKRKTYWYDLILNDNITMQGYSDDRSK